MIGWDGGLVRESYEVQRILIAPGERYDVLVDLEGTAGDRLALRTLHYDRGHDIPDPGPIDILVIELDGEPRMAAPLPALAAIEPIGIAGATSRRLTLREDDSDPLAPVFTINDEAFPAVTPVEVALDRVEIWEIENATEMDHPFHLHGMSFQIADCSPPLGWKDTINIPRQSTVPIAVRFTALGQWMFHCHILEHAERGMMGHLHVR